MTVGAGGGADMNARSALGRYGEGLAARRLAQTGMTVLERNWRCRQGELDIVARAGTTLAFCEVNEDFVSRARGPDTVMDPVSSDGSAITRSRSDAGI